MQVHDAHHVCGSGPERRLRVLTRQSRFQQLDRIGQRGAAHQAALPQHIDREQQRTGAGRTQLAPCSVRQNAQVIDDQRDRHIGGFRARQLPQPLQLVQRIIDDRAFTFARKQMEVAAGQRVLVQRVVIDAEEHALEHSQREHRVARIGQRLQQEDQLAQLLLDVDARRR